MRRISLRGWAAICVASLVSGFGSLLVSADTSTPINVTASGVAVTENFNSLALSGTASATPIGWGFVESSGNTVYTAGTGTGTSGDTYSFGPAAAAERALGGVRSGSNVPTLGAAFTNYTGSPITSRSATQESSGGSAPQVEDRIGLISRSA